MTDLDRSAILKKTRGSGCGRRGRGGWWMVGEGGGLNQISAAQFAFCFTSCD